MRNNNVSRKDRLKSKRRAPANYLIVCEGKKTEPNYFNGLKKKINNKYGNKVDVLIPNIEVKGTGRNTTDLVKYTQKYVNYSSKVYGQVWVVFDKDDYNDEQFNKAIENCDYNACWSNPNFELWLLAHLKKVTRYISKDDILDELSKEFQKNGLGEYNKNDADIFEIYATAIPLALDDGPKVAKSIFSMLYFEYGWMEIKKQEKILITISYHFCM